MGKKKKTLLTIIKHVCQTLCKETKPGLPGRFLFFFGGGARFVEAEDC